MNDGHAKGTTAVLELLVDGRSRHCIVLDRRDTLIGRSAVCDVSIPEPSVSRRHALVVRADDGFMVEDLDSRHGVFVDDARVRRGPLRNGSIIRLGTATLRYVETDDEALTSESLAFSHGSEAAARWMNAAVVAALDRLPMGIVVTAAGGRPLVVNRAARALLSEADGLSLFEGALRAWDAASQRTLRGLLEDEGDHGGALRLRRPSGRRDYEARVTPLRPLGTGPEAHGLKAVFLTDPERSTRADVETLLRLYRLTPAEAALATELAQGKSLTQTAAELKVSVDTARTHLKHVFLKTGASRQGELVWLLLTGPGAIPAD